MIKQKKQLKKTTTPENTENVEERIENTDNDNAFANLPVVAQALPVAQIVPANELVVNNDVAKDTVKPVIELIGGDVVLRMGNEYEELGATATDDVDGNLTNSIVISGEVGEAKGTYVITYNVSDNSGNKAEEVTRTVYVVDDSELADALDNAGNILNNDNSDNEELNELINKLEEAVENGNKVIEDETSKQEDIDKAAEDINKIIDSINELTFIVRFVDYNDSTISEQRVSYYETAVVPENPVRFGHTFAGWNGSYTNVTQDEVVKATYTLDTYSISYTDALNAVNNNATKYTVNKIEIISDLEKLGYTFGGFTFNGKLVKSTEGYAENLSLFANWTLNNYKITLDPDNGTTLDDIEYTVLDTVTLPTPVKEGYKFLGWYNGNAKIESVITGNYDLKAKYELINYTITYNDELNVTNNNETSYNVENNVTISDLEKTGYTFNGWFDGTTKITSTEGYTKNLELTASWTLDTYKINYTYDGTLDKANITEYNVNTVFTLNNPHKDNYTFDGWYNGETKVTKIENMTGELNLVGVYTANQTGIKAEYKVNTFLQFNKGQKDVNVKDYINVYPVYADGTTGEALAQDQYEITGFTTKDVTASATLTVKQKNTNYTDTLEYSIVNSKAVQTKFEVVAPGKNYRKTKSSTCKSDCDSRQKTNSEGTKENVLEIIEHYDQYITVYNVVVNNNQPLSIKKNRWGSNDAVRWTDKWWGDIYNPVYIATNGDYDHMKALDINKINTVSIAYSRTFENWMWSTTKYYVVVFQNVNGKFVAIDEYEIH